MYSNYEKLLSRLPKPVLISGPPAVILLSAYLFGFPHYVTGAAILFGFLAFFSKPILRLFRRCRMKPNHLTVGGFLLSAVAGVLFACGYPHAGFLATIAATGLLDVWDGLMARMFGLQTRFGGILDSVLDRLADGFILGGVSFRLLLDGNWIWGTVALYGTITAQVVSYARARAETQIPSCEVSFWGGRPERIFLLCFFGLIGYLPVGLAAMGILQSLTIIRRIWFTYKELHRYTEEIPEVEEPENLSPRVGTTVAAGER